jgi:hypothetical protein
MVKMLLETVKKSLLKTVMVKTTFLKTEMGMASLWNIGMAMEMWLARTQIV